MSYLHRKTFFTPNIMNILEKNARKLFYITEKFRRQKTIQDKCLREEKLCLTVAIPPFPWRRTLIFLSLFGTYCYCVC